MIAAIVLAAGASTRLGRAKQLLLHRGRSLVRAATEEALASECDRVVVVLGAREEEIRGVIEDLPVDVVVNDAWKEGMASSIRRGIAWVAREACEAAILVVCDQPALTAAHLDRLVAEHRRGGAIVASRYAGSLGVPALFGRAAFPALLELHGNEGAKRVLRAEGALAVDWPEGEIDVDTPEDAARLE